MNNYKKHFHGKFKEYYPNNSKYQLFEIELYYDTLKEIDLYKQYKNPMDRRHIVSACSLVMFMVLDRQVKIFLGDNIILSVPNAKLN